jgi:hypothetical protein
MAVELEWNDLCQATGAFTPAEMAAGCPVMVTLEQFAAMQRPCKRGDKTGHYSRRVLLDAMQAACTAGELDHTTETKEVKPQQVRRVVNAYMDDKPGAGFWAARGFTRQW